MTQARLEIYTGPMFAGKSTHLLEAANRIDRFTVKNLTVIVHSFEASRQEVNMLVTHDARSIPAVSLPTSQAVISHCMATKAEVVFIDELQFFDDGIVGVLRQLVDANVPVYGAGLDQTFQGSPFGPMAALLIEANVVHKLVAKCAACGQSTATRSFRISNSDQVVLVGGEKLYEARCRKCWADGMRGRDL